MVVALSTGSCYDLGFNQKQAINFVKKYSMLNGIELVFATPKDLLDFELSKTELDFILSLDFKSIHMPFYQIKYLNDSKTKKLIKKSSKIANKINADYLVFHPNNILEYSVLDWSQQNCIENLNSKEKNDGFQTVKDIGNLLKEHPKLGLILDTCHMLEANLSPRSFLALKNNVFGLHLAVQWAQKERIRTHGFLQENIVQLNQIKPLLKLNVPKIIEVDIYPNKLNMLQKEIDLIKNLE